MKDNIKKAIKYIKDRYRDSLYKDKFVDFDITMFIKDPIYSKIKILFEPIDREIRGTEIQDKIDDINEQWKESNKLETSDLAVNFNIFNGRSNEVNVNKQNDTIKTCVIFYDGIEIHRTDIFEEEDLGEVLFVLFPGDELGLKLIDQLDYPLTPYKDMILDLGDRRILAHYNQKEQAMYGKEVYPIDEFNQEIYKVIVARISAVKEYIEQPDATYPKFRERLLRMADKLSIGIPGMYDIKIGADGKDKELEKLYSYFIEKGEDNTYTLYTEIDILNKAEIATTQVWKGEELSDSLVNFFESISI